MSESSSNTAATCPITNYEDINVIEAAAGWHFNKYSQLREESPIYQGSAGDNPDFFLLTRMQEMRESYQNAKVFSNASVTPTDPNPPFKWIPEMLDGKIHVAWRQLLGPLWTPAAVSKLKPQLRKRFAEILGTVAEQGHCDVMNDVALLFPNVIFMDLMGLPRADAEQFQEWEVAMLHSPQSELEAQFQVMMQVMEYFTALIAERRKQPQDDMLSYVLASKIDDAPIPDEDILAFCLLMFLAGLDTVATQLTFNFWHLATHDEDRLKIVKDPSLIPAANEELLRYYSFVSPSRKVLEDTVIAGCPVKAGSMVMMPLNSANRDPREFPEADKVIFERESNRHVAFGVGPHRCLGSHLAREELLVAMTMWHERIPNYRIAKGFEVKEHGGQVGIGSLQIEWDV